VFDDKEGGFDEPESAETEGHQTCFLGVFFCVLFSYVNARIVVGNVYEFCTVIQPVSKILLVKLVSGFIAVISIVFIRPLSVAIR